METKGCDYAWSRPDPDALYANGYRFASRYLSYDNTGKNLSLTEAQALTRAGLLVVSNWEAAERGALGGLSAGRAHAIAASAQHAQCGGSPYRPIYFSIDFNPSTAELVTVRDYFRGIATVLPLNRIGVYGGLLTVSAVFGGGLAGWAWQTYAWSGGAWLPGVHIRQTHNGVNFQGADIDEDLAQVADFGCWTTDRTTPLALTWTQEMIMQLPTVSRGATGRDVSRVQGLLHAFGYTLTIDGNFGPITDGSVQAFQRNHGLLVDGIVGQHTWTALLTV